MSPKNGRVDQENRMLGIAIKRFRVPRKKHVRLDSDLALQCVLIFAKANIVNR